MPDFRPKSTEVRQHPGGPEGNYNPIKFRRAEASRKDSAA